MSRFYNTKVVWVDDMLTSLLAVGAEPELQTLRITDVDTDESWVAKKPDYFQITLLVNYQVGTGFFREGLVLFSEKSHSPGVEQFKDKLVKATEEFIIKYNKFTKNHTTEPQLTSENTSLPKGINTGEDARVFNSDSKDLNQGFGPTGGGKYKDEL
jgi:hypothetical protein